MMRRVKADLHNYLKSRSDMSTLVFNDIVDQASAVLGKGGVVGITNYHDFCAEQFFKLDGYTRRHVGNGVIIPEKDILLVKNQMVPTQQGDVLVLGVQSGMALHEGLPLEETLDEVENADAIAVLTGHHRGIRNYITQLGGVAQRQILGRFDALMIHNAHASLWIPGILHYGENEKTQRFYEDVCCPRRDRLYGEYGAISVSNGIHPREIGRNHTIVRMPDHESLTQPRDVVAALRQAVRHAEFFECTYKNSNLMATVHAAIVLFDHNPLAYALKGRPNAHLDESFTKQQH